MEKQFLDYRDFPYLCEIDIRVLKSEKLSPDEKVLLLRYYTEDIPTVCETLEDTATWVKMSIKKVQKVRNSLVKKGYLQEIVKQTTHGDKTSSSVKAYRPLFDKLRDEG